jgi:hypothetical protein
MISAVFRIARTVFQKLACDDRQRIYGSLDVATRDDFELIAVAGAGKRFERLAMERGFFAGFFGSELAGQISMVNCSGSVPVPESLLGCKSTDSATLELGRPVAGSMIECLTAAVACQTGSNQLATGNGRLNVGHTVNLSARIRAAKTNALGAK